MKRQNYDVMVKNGKRKTENRRNRYLCVILFFGVDVAKLESVLVAWRRSVCQRIGGCICEG